MNKKELFSDKRWNQPLGGVVIGHVEITDEMKEKVKEYKEKLEERKTNKINNK